MSADDEVLIDVDELPEGGTEGRRRLLTHLARERNRALVRAKKTASRRERGNLACEVCGFDFATRYGLLGQDFCEVHHLLPLAALKGQRRTRLADLAVICSNCHRMAHRDGAIRSLEELRTLLQDDG
jgi:5-methylcytosine-specific restriction protein A